MRISIIFGNITNYELKTTASFKVWKLAIFTEMFFLFLLFFFSSFLLFENTALHLAAIQDHPDVVSCLLSSDKQEILMNKKNQNVLDAAVEAEQKSVLLTIANHKR